MVVVQLPLGVCLGGRVDQRPRRRLGQRRVRGRRMGERHVDGADSVVESHALEVSLVLTPSLTVCGTVFLIGTRVNRDDNRYGSLW